MPALKSATYLLSLITMTLLDAMAYAGDERAELDLIIRQLQTAGQVAQRAEQALNSGARYRLDYPRLRNDLQHIEAGLHDYLSPRRAQPADPSELIGDYTTEPARELLP
jgi:RAQPRD family integrative conjugative element protein